MSAEPIRALLVDDDEDFHVLLSRVLRDAIPSRILLSGVRDYDGALREAASGRHDILLVDYYLGERNGLELLQELRRRGLDLPFILLTGRGDAEIDRRALEAGASDYLEKYGLDARALERSLRYSLGRHRDLQALRKSESTYRSLIEQSTDAIFIADLRMNILEVNEQACRLQGYGREEALGVNIVRDLCDPKDLAEHPLRMEEMLSGNVVVSERRLRRRDGSWYTAEIRIRLIDGNRFQGVIRDVTDRKTSEEKLKESEQYYRLLLENSRDVALIIGPDRTITYEAPSTKRVLGREPGEMVGQNAFVNMHPDDVQRLRSEFQRVLERPGETVTLELRMRHNDGSWRWVEGNAQNLLDHPLIRGIVINYRDITARKEAEGALRASEERFRALLENATDIVGLVDRDGRNLYLTPSVERIIGYTPGERRDRSFFELMHPEDIDRARALFRKMMEEPGRTVHSRIRLRHKNGDYHIVEGAGQNLLHNPSVQAIVLNYRDVTDQYRAQDQLLRYERLATLGEITAGLAHEIRNPLATILSAAQYLKSKVPDAGIAASLDSVIEQAERIRQLVNETLDYSKNPSLHLEDIHVPSLLGRALMLARTQYGPDHAKTRVLLEVPEDLPPLRADRRRLEQALVNLILNAFQALAPRGGEMTLSCGIIKGEIQLSVRDNGPGIRDEDLPKVFEPFFSTKKHGSGLGLSICQRMAREHGGRVAVERPNSGGAAFTIVLPLDGSRPA
jgi:PAS domain S-box-containing protein